MGENGTVGQPYSLQELALKNFRCFPELRVQFHERLTVLVARNGGGKTALLDGIAVGLRPFVDKLGGRSMSAGFTIRDTRRRQTRDGRMEMVQPVRLELRGTFGGVDLHWARQGSGRTTMAEAKPLQNCAAQLLGQIRDWDELRSPVDPVQPLICYYGTGRLWDSNNRLSAKLKVRGPAPNGRSTGYVDCLSSSSHYKFFLNWFRRFSYASKQFRDDTGSLPPNSALQAIGKAVDIALRSSGWHSLEWDFAEDEARVSHPAHGRLPVDMLSDGVRSMIGLVADLAHRAVRLNPQYTFLAAMETPGIVLIDEVDLHLHPEWQQRILSSLLDAFPKVQFIVTTHSPQVLTTTRKENIRVLAADANGEWSARQPENSPLAHDSSDALALVMDVAPRPELGVTKDIHAYELMAREGGMDSEAALKIRGRLDAEGFEFGGADQALFEFLARKAHVKRAELV